MSGVNKFNKQEYLYNLSKMTNSEFMKEWDDITSLFQTKLRDTYVIVKVVKRSRNKRTSTGRRFIYGKSEK